MAVLRGRQFFQNPGPTNIPDRVLRAMDRATLDFVQDEFVRIREECTDGLRKVFRTSGAVVTYPASGHGAWEATLVNLFSPGDRVLVLESGYFSASWASMAEAFGLTVETLPGDWRMGVDPDAVADRLRRDLAGEIRAVMLVHNETSTGVANRCAEIRQAIDAAVHPALFLVDVISSLASFDFRMDEWKVDVTVGGSQKGLMLPPGMCFTALSKRALDATQSAQLPRKYWDWRPKLSDGRQTGYAGTAPVHMYFGLQESLRMIFEEGLEAVFARHHRLAEATRAAVRAWGREGGPELYVRNPAVESDSLTAVLMPPGRDAEAVREVCLRRFNVSLGGGLDTLNGRVFRIGHMGDLNEAMLLGALACVELSLEATGTPFRKGGVDAAMAALAHGPQD